MPDWQPLRVTRFVWQAIENRSKAVTHPSASLKLENMGLSCRKTACVAICKNEEILDCSINSARVAASSRRTRALGNILANVAISSETIGAFSSTTPTNSGELFGTDGFSRQYLRTEALGA